MNMSSPSAMFDIAEPEREHLYFAYGSNMHLQQMAKRCPQSSLFANGRLQGYKWQVNSRGGGNVVKAGPDDAVYGVVFKVPSRDIQALRSYEGVEKQYFVEETLPIQMERFLNPNLRNQKTADVADFFAPNGLDYVQSNPIENLAIEFGNPETLEALVYISYMYSSPGIIREGYSTRMQMAIADARFLGLSEEYLTNLLSSLIYREKARV